MKNLVTLEFIPKIPGNLTTTRNLLLGEFLDRMKIILRRTWKCLQKKKCLQRSMCRCLITFKKCCVKVVKLILRDPRGYIFSTAILSLMPVSVASILLVTFVGYAVM